MGLVKIFSISLFSEAFVLLAGFVNSIVITRNLDLAGRGEYALTMNVVLILSLIFGDSLYRSNTYLISKNRKDLSRLISNGMVAILFLGFLLFSIFCLSGQDVFQQILPGVHLQLVFIAFLSLIPLIFIRCLNGLFLGMQKYYVFNFLVVAPLCLYCLLNVGLSFWGGFSPEKVMRNYLIAMVFFMVIAFIILVRTESFHFELNWHVAKQSMQTGIKSGISTVTLFLLFRVDIFFVNYFLGTDQAGLYSIAALVAELLQKFANTSGTIIFPQIAGESRPLRGYRLSVRVVLFVAVVGVIFALVVLVFGERLIVFLFQKAYAPAIIPLYYLLPGTVVMAVGKIIIFSLWGKGFPKVTIWVPLCAFILNVVLNLVLIPRLGIMGAALSTSISYLVFGISLILYFFVHPQLKMDHENESKIDVPI
ncbi:polysaccharide biosynthesis C-terminal domain-containing protein [bacterium]|nr:polysaccharide biosynthesis C-terminal domain-containing protein [bacterium]RQV92208.1 MAG: hypothetical protein EH221_11885 [bacterium]